MARTFKDLIVYQKGFSLAMEIFHLSKGFPKEEIYSLTGQIRGSSRSVCSNLAEGYRKRRYEAHFISKISDADMENSETQVWLDFALACGYISQKIYDELTNKSEEVGRMINHMIEHPENTAERFNDILPFANCQLPTANCQLPTGLTDGIYTNQ